MNESLSGQSQRLKSEIPPNHNTSGWMDGAEGGGGGTGEEATLLVCSLSLL